MKKIILFIVIGLLVLTGAGLFSFNLWQIREKRIALQLKKANWQWLENKIHHQLDISNLEVGVVVKDLSTGWTIAINENKLFPSASMVKVPIMASYVYAWAKGKEDLGKSLMLKNEFKVSGSGVLKDYASGSKFNIDKLIELMVTESDNTAANMLIDNMGFDNLNTYFKKIGLNQTNISRWMMDFQSRKEGVENYTSARDLAFLLEKIYDNRLINRNYSRKCLEILKRQKIRDRIPAKLPYNTVVAHKTGLENGICHDAGIVFTPRGDFIICVLIKHNNKYARPAKKFISRISLDTYNFYNLDLNNF